MIPTSDYKWKYLPRTITTVTLVTNYHQIPQLSQQ